MNNEKVMKQLIRNGACREARDWIDSRTAEQIVAECPRGDWLIWALQRSGASLTTWRRVALAEADAVAYLDPTPEGARAREAARAVLASDTPETRAAAARAARAAAWTAAWATSADRIRAIITTEERARLIAWLGGES